jgi:hypothetical protein
VGRTARDPRRDAFGAQADANTTVVFTRDDGGTLTTADQDQVGEIADAVQSAGIEHVIEVTTGSQFVAPNQAIQLADVALEGNPNDPELTQAIRDLRDELTSLVDGLRPHPGDRRHHDPGTDHRPAAADLPQPGSSVAPRCHRRTRRQHRTGADRVGQA